jgi:hypothetical protein
MRIEIVEPTALSGEVTEVAGSSEYSLDLYQIAVCLSCARSQ